VQEICQQHGVTHLFYNYQYEFNEQQRDRQLENMLEGVVCEGFDDSVMLAPGSVMTGNHEMYKVFTPFKNAFIKRLKEALPECVAAPAVRGEAITDLPELTFNYPQQPFDETCSPPMRKRLLPNCASFANRARPVTTRAGFSRH
jgi:deoxyribodipyrimidine photo-lyase